MRRRRRGSGAIEKTRDGLYRARFAFTAGKREDIDGSPFDTYEQAETALDALLAVLHDGGIVQGGITLRKLGQKALAQRELDGYRSVDGERDVWDLRVETWDLASQPAASITKGDVREWLSKMRRKNGKRLGTQTRRNARNVLSAVFAYGVENEFVTENPCDGVKVKDHGRTTDGCTHLSATEAERLVGIATDPAVALAIGTGMRSGELRSLRWDDVQENEIIVRYGSPEKPSKNGKVRRIPILPLARRGFERLREKSFEGIVLPSVTGGYRARGQVFNRLDWKAWILAAKLGRRVRPHDLRHTCATLLLTGAWGRKWTYEEVKEMLGHSSVKVTERYAHAVGTLAQQAAAEMDKPAISPQPDPPNAAQVVDIVGRRGSDSNRRMTVLQTEHTPQKIPAEVDLAGLARAYLEAVARNEPTAIAKGLTLAGAVLDACASEPAHEAAS